MNQQPRSSDSFPMWPVLVLLGMFGVLLLIVLAGNASTRLPVTPTPAPTQVAELPTATLPPPITGGAAGPDPAMVAAGKTIFSSICFACHGQDAHGIPGLGKDLVTSTFVHSQTDDELLAFLQKGRPVFDPLNTTGVEMPPRGGNPSLTDSDLLTVIAYLRTLNGAPEASGQQAAGAATAAPTSVPAPTSSEPTKPFVIPGANIGATPAGVTEVPAFTAAAPTQEATAAITEAAPTQEAIGAVTAPRGGQQIYVWACSGCHGANGEGVQYVGLAITSSSMLTDSAALTSLLTNTQMSGPSGFVHPYRGGYPPLTDAEISNLIDYLKTLGK
jgi:mono/diheme cytochrome c family protein